MPAHSDDGLTEKSIDVLFRAALEVVADNFNAAEHLPKPVYDFLLPVPLPVAKDFTLRPCSSWVQCRPWQMVLASGFGHRSLRL